MDFNSDNISKFKGLIEQAEEIVLFVHHNPDGDALGSSLALKTVLESMNKKATVISPNELPGFLSFLPGFSSVVVYDSSSDDSKQLIDSADLYICCDFNRPERMNNLHKIIDFGRCPSIVIDHHPFPLDFVTLIFSETKVSSTSELVFHILESSGYLSQLPVSGADSLFVGIVTDTGGFSHNCSTPDIYLAVAKLMEIGVQRDAIYDHIFRSNTIERLKLTGNCLGNNLVHLDEFGAAYFCISDKDKDIYNIKPGDTEGLVNMPLSVKGITLSAMFTENEGMVKVSLRSKYDFPANAICEKYFNGGGHTNAAGGRVNMSLTEAVALYIKSLEEYKSELIRYKAYAVSQ